MDDEEKLDALIGLLGKQLHVATDEGTVTIGIEWNDPNMAFRLVEAAQQNFLEARHASEVSTIAETISILEGHAANVRETIDGTLDDLHKARTQEEEKRPRQAADSPRREAAPDKELTEVRVMLNAKRRAIADLEEFRQKRMAELQTLLAEQRQTYAPGHPTLANTLQNIQALSTESPQITQLKHEEKELLAEYNQRGGKDRAEVPRTPINEVAQALLEHGHRESDEDENVSYARSRLKIAMANYDELLDRIEGARIELDTARAAFKYRYSVISPAQVPKRPEKPKPATFLGIGIFMALVLALLTTTLLDLSSGRILESWQVERRLGLPVLGEVKKP
jgi:chromosome segregation ATPase